MKFISYTRINQEGPQSTDWRSAQALSMGGVRFTPEKITLYAPRVPPLEIGHPNPEVLEILSAAIVSFLTNPAASVPGMVDYGMNLNAAIMAAEHAVAAQAAAPAESP